MTTSLTERDPRVRCKSAHYEREHRTHRCKFGLLHDGENHECICGRKWNRNAEVIA